MEPTVISFTPRPASRDLKIDEASFGIGRDQSDTDVLSDVHALIRNQKFSFDRRLS